MTVRILPTLWAGLPSAVFPILGAGWPYKMDTHECLQVIIALDVDCTSARTYTHT